MTNFFAEHLMWLRSGYCKIKLITASLRTYMEVLVYFNNKKEGKKRI